MARDGENRTPEEMASQRINATNPGHLALQNASRGGISDFGKAAAKINAQSAPQEETDSAENRDFMQLMYEQGSERDRVDRISREREGQTS